jgi:hypothetical protein
MPFCRVLAASVLLCLACPLIAQESGKTISAADIDFSGLVRETQQSPNEPGYVGLVWWIPTEYWVLSSERMGVPAEKAKERYAPLQRYTVAALAFGKIGIANVNWLTEPEIRDNTLLRDSEGITYPPLQKLTGDAEGLQSMLKPIFVNILGTMGQNIQLLFFPATNKTAKPIADPLAAGDFSIVVSKIIGGKDKAFEWKLPLTAVLRSTVRSEKSGCKQTGNTALGTA